MFFFPIKNPASLFLFYFQIFFYIIFFAFIYSDINKIEKNFFPFSKWSLTLKKKTFNSYNITIKIKQIHNKENSLQKEIKRKEKNQFYYLFIYYYYYYYFIMDKKKRWRLFFERRRGRYGNKMRGFGIFSRARGLVSPLLLFKFLIKYLLFNLYKIIPQYI